MKRLLSVLLLALMIVVVIPVNAVSTTENGKGLIYVSTDGDDSNDGSINYPLASLAAARDKIRELKGTGLYPRGFTVYVRGGNYSITESFILSNEDSGTEEAPITYRAYEGEKVTLTGGVSVDAKAFSKVTEKAILDRVVTAAARDKIYQIDLKEYGITDVGETYWKGAYSYITKFIDAGVVQKPKASGSELLFNGKAMTLARYPDDENLMTKMVVTEGWTSANPNNLPIRTPFTITVSTDRIAKWQQAVQDGNALMYGFWRYDWADQTIPIKNINVEKKEITGTLPGAFGVLPEKPFYVYNLIEELDQPGEYYLDNKNSILYIYPPEELTSAEVTLTLLDEPIIQMKNTEYITFKGIDILGTRSNAYIISGGSHNLITDCEISYTAQKAVNITGSYNGIRDCYIHDVEGGASVYGGDESSLTKAYSFVENCEFERFSRLSGTYVSAVFVGGVGNIVQYNEIHDAPHLAIEFAGNYNKIQYNNVYDVLQTTDDASAIYGGLSWVARGNEIKYNYVHDLMPTLHSAGGAAGIAAIYLDGGLCETFIVGNIFENIDGRGIWFNGGRDNVAMNNIIINCKQGMYFTDIMIGEQLESHHYSELNKKPYVRNEVWQKAFPKLQAMLELSDEEKVLPFDNVFLNNVAYKTKLINDVTDTGGKEVSFYMDCSQNLAINEDPGFYDLAGRNYTITDESKLYTDLPGFVGVPFTRMGCVDERAKARIRNAKILIINNPNTFVNGKERLIDVENKEVVPFIKNDVTYVPLRFLAEVLDATVEFDTETGMVNINGTGVSMTVPSKGTEATKNGEKITLSNPTIIVQDRTMVPLREVSELFDKNIFWHPSGFISVSDDETLFDENGSDDEIIRYLSGSLNIY